MASERFYVNDRPVHVKKEHPKVSEVLEAAGYSPVDYRAHLLVSREDRYGEPIGADERLDASRKPVYLKCTPRAQGTAGIERVAQTVEGQGMEGEAAENLQERAPLTPPSNPEPAPHEPR